jgi:hypothetical protein
MAAIFQNVDDLIDQHLGVNHIGRTSPHYRSTTAALSLASKPAHFRSENLLEAILKQMRTNLTEGQLICMRRASSENWRWEKKLYISERNRSPEKMCEKAIASTCGDDWVNQMPTASGLIDDTSEKHCNIDLVFRNAPGEYTFIELKYQDSTPLYAAFEIVKYGLLYALSRELAGHFGYSLDLRPVLGARVVHLCVVAPRAYYDRFHLRWLQQDISHALSAMDCSGYRMDFCFQSMRWPHDNDFVDAVATRTVAYAHG